MHEPRLTRVARGDCVYWTDEALRTRAGVIVAFSERVGGVSRMPFATLNLAAHVGDDPEHVDENRARFLSATGLEPLRARLVTAEQVHGTHIAPVDQSDAGRGAFAATGRPPVAEADGLVTATPDLPLMLFFADCVPVVLVALTQTQRAVCVVHAGWRGALSRIAASGAHSVRQAAGPLADVIAYIGPHICAQDYTVGEEVLSQFDTIFATVSRAGTGAVDLGAAVSASLVEAGVPMSAQCSLGACTAGQTDRFFSYRAEGATGRHSAFAAMVGRGA